ncbi:MAG: D-cysteine desulfhydrase [Parvularculaceae bacterium]
MIFDRDVLVRKLAAFPRASLICAPTPLEAMPRLTAALGGPRLFVKRDDCTGFAGGGNKGRKLEFTLGDALAKGAQAMITEGGLQSNWVRQAAAACARAGIEFHAVMANPLDHMPEGYDSSGNMLLTRLFGAHIHIVADDGPATAAKIAALVDAATRDGRRPYCAPLGASDGVGALGYVAAAFELLEQIEMTGLDVSHIALATGSGGTHAGLMAGFALAGAEIEIIGVSPSEPAPAKQAKVARIAGETLGLLGAEDLAPSREAVKVADGYVGRGYGYPTEGGMTAIRDAARAEGLLLDPVYTGKALAGLRDLIVNGALTGTRDIVFLHTGGAPALFAYPRAEYAV